MLPLNLLFFRDTILADVLLDTWLMMAVIASHAVMIVPFEFPKVTHSNAPITLPLRAAVLHLVLADGWAGLGSGLGSAWLIVYDSQLSHCANLLCLAGLAGLGRSTGHC